MRTRNTVQVQEKEEDKEVDRGEKGGLILFVLLLTLLHLHQTPAPNLGNFMDCPR